LRVLLAIAAALAVTAIAAPEGAQAASAPRITQIECAKHPSPLFDLVYITNQGDAPQDLAGWSVRSDPEGSEQMSLAPAGTLDPGEQIILAAGTHAVNLPNEGLYLWTNLEVLRDPPADPPDYARLYDASGAFVSGLDCNGQPQSAAPPPAAPPPAPAAPQQPATGTGTGGGGQTTTAPTSTAPRAQSSGPKAIPASGGQTGSDGAAYWLPLGIVGMLAGAALVTLGLRTDAIVARITSSEGERRTDVRRRRRG
jgi:hypothetical protein